MSVTLDAGLRMPPSPPADSAADVQTATAGGDPTLKVGTYNVGAGNAGAREDFGDTTRLIADKVTGGDVDALALQEVDVGTGRAADIGVDDYNEAILADILRAEVGADADAPVHRYSLDENGQAVHYDPERYATTVYEVTDGDGRTGTMTVERESYSEDGQPYLDANGARAFDAGGGSPITVYSARVETGGRSRDYTMVYGSSIGHDGGVYGNAVLLGPDAGLQRGPDGEIAAGSLVRHDLGANDPKGENRTALAVGIASGGERSTVISAHFTADGSDAGDAARDTQYETLGRIAEGYGDNTIVLGDFNSSRDTVGGLEGANDPGFWSWGSPIDRIYVSDDVEAADRDHVEGGGSDHNMITWEVTL